MTEAFDKIAEKVDVAAKEINELICKADPESVIGGLTILAGAMALLLDTYAAPNPENPEGMADDWYEFRRYFCQMVMTFGAERDGGEAESDLQGGSESCSSQETE